jgi:hypothetical protein
MQYQTHTYDDNNLLVSDVNQMSAGTNLRVYPNPSNRRIYILGAIEGVSVFNIMGQKIFTEKEIASLDISNWEWNLLCKIRKFYS